MRKLVLPLSTVLTASIIFVTLGFKNLKKEEVVKENNEAKELIDKMDTSFDLFPFEISLEEKLLVLQRPESIVDLYKKNTLTTPNPPDWDCASLCWRQFSNCWEGLSYLNRGSESWIQAVNKCFSDVLKCSNKCRKEKNVGGPIQ